MKIVEITHRNLTVAITNEEAEVLDLFDDQSPVIARNELDERQIILANQLVNKDILIRRNENGHIIYKKQPGKTPS